MMICRSLPRFARPAFAILAVGMLVALPASARADLTADVEALLAAKPLARAQVGVQVIRLGQDPAGSAIVYARNPQLPLSPASNMKLLTTSAALERLGGGFRFRTILYQRGDDLVIVGDGDPTLGDAELLKPHGGTPTSLFEAWAEMLKARGVSRVNNVLIDDAVFDDAFAHPNWPADDLPKRYGAQVGGLNLNGNCLDFYLQPGQRGTVVSFRLDPPTKYAAISNACLSGGRSAVWLTRKPESNDVVLRGEINAPNGQPVSVTVHDPPMFFGTVLAETLRRGGVDVAGKVARERWAQVDTAVPLAAHETPIEVVLRRANKDSVNLYAEALMKRLGREASGQPGSWVNGREAIGQFLASRGVPAGEASVDDGSGLSKENRVSANAITRVLMGDFYSANREAFLASLAVGGADGTLEKRFTNDLRGRVYAKTGYIGGVRALSGYLRGRSGNWYAFSILMNGPLTGEARQIADKIVAAVDKND